ncbi:acyl-coenzyme A synthetase/AMP-(fatty) acid ligase [Bradyrhizobium sp. i1.8.4]|uniref:hypothetical protein n=1 Tax=unclassified Bradyrhizobium TaxID=2631580 RepID=UPI003D237276
MTANGRTRSTNRAAVAAAALLLACLAGSAYAQSLFGAGEADALAAVMAATNAPVAATADKPSQPVQEVDGNNTSVSRVLNDTAPSIASDDFAANHRAAQ